MHGFPLTTLALCAVLVGGNAAAASVHLADIVGAAPAAINDFEAVAGGLVGSTWAQQGIRVTQIGGDPVGIWTASGLGNGARSWYPDAGDDGWTRITLDSGDNFDAVSFFGDSGHITPPQSIYFELADDGVVVLSGLLDATFAGQWRGFSGGDFDEVRLRASRAPLSLEACVAVPGSRCNYFWIDDIKIGAAALPEPGSVALLLAAAMVARQRRRDGRTNL